MDVTLAHPEGDLIPDVVEVAPRTHKPRAAASAREGDEEDLPVQTSSPKSWAPFKVMQTRTELLRANDHDGLKALEKRCLAQNALHRNWHCTEEMMKLTKGGQALYMHCLPADISGVSCKEGEVQGSVFERFRIATYKEASWKPYVIAAMIMARKYKRPELVLEKLLKEAQPRVR